MLKKIVKFFKIFLTPPRYADSLVSFAIGMLMITGLLFSTSASINVSSSAQSTLWSFFKQMVILIISIIGYHFISHIYSRELAEKYINQIAYFVGGLLLFAVVWCYINGAINNNYSWIYLGFFSIQPLELAKITMILLIATKLADKRFNGITKPIEILKDPLTFFGAYIVIIFFLQKDKGSAFVLAVISCLCFLIPSHKLLRKYQALVLMGAVGFVFAYVFCLSSAGQNLLRSVGLGTIAARFEAVVNPSYYSDATREIFYSLLGISKGQLFGVGFGNSIQKFGYLVSSDADYIFAIIVEETGLIGIGLVFIPYFVLIARLLYYCKKVEKESDRVVLVGAVSYLFVHMIFNIGGVSGMIPLTGVPLLLLSKGGSATISIMAVLGMCQSIINRHETEKIQRKQQTL